MIVFHGSFLSRNVNLVLRNNEVFDTRTHGRAQMLGVLLADISRWRPRPVSRRP
jgi:hypothetical protein